MDLAAPSDSPDLAHAHGRFHIYVQVAMVLAVITGLEILFIFLPFPKPLLVSALVTSSAIKFLFVIFIFMHLRWDKRLCTALFFIGLVIAGGIMWAVINLFSITDSIPLTFHS